MLRVQDGVPILYFRPFKVRAHVYQETGVVEKVVVEVYRRSAKGEDIGERYDALLSKHGVSYESRQGGFGWHASTGRLQMVFHRLAPKSLDPLFEGRIEVDPEENDLPFPHPGIVANLCEALIGTVSTRGKGSGFASVLGGRGRGRPFDPDYLIPAVVAWYVGGTRQRHQAARPEAQRGQDTARQPRRRPSLSARQDALPQRRVGFW